MNQRNITLAKILTYSGTLPLMVCAALMIMLQAGIISQKGIAPSFIAHAYSAVIISFLCGIHWAIYLFFSEKCPRNLLMTSNIIALIVWVSLIIQSYKASVLLQPFCFLYVLMLDRTLRDAGILPEWFYHLRRNATIIVVLCLSIVAGLS